MAVSEFRDDDIDLLLEANREKSFKNWGFDEQSKCSSKKMAEAGFVHVSGDAVKCFVCLKELDGWEPNDDPWIEHKKHTVDKGLECEFVKLGKPEKVMTVVELLRLCKARHKRLLVAKGRAVIKEFEDNAALILRQLESM